MTSAAAGFRTEAQLVRRGRVIIRRALGQLDSPARTRYEVKAPGSIPDLILFAKKGRDVRYLVTIEFKLRNWRRAIHQAFRHRNFGNESYVVLDQKHSGPALRQLNVFREANIGLLTISIDGKVSAWYYPVPTLPFSSQVSRYVAKVLLSSPRVVPEDLLFIRSVRGGVALSELRSFWGSAHRAS